MAHVVSAVLGASGPLLLKLAGLLAGEYGRLKGVRRAITALETEVKIMDAALKTYSDMDDLDVQDKEWMSILRELAYDIEDHIDKFIHRLGKGGRRARHQGGFKEFFRNTTFKLKEIGARSGFADDTDKLYIRIKQTKELNGSYKLSGTPSAPSRHAAVDPRLYALSADGAHLVGLDGPKDDLAIWMMKENSSSKHRRVLSIVGFPGLGKTTLASAVYRRIQESFHCQAFVSVSQKPDIKKIIKSVISQVSCQDGPINTYDWDERTYMAKLEELLQNKKYLIVIDDIWSTSVWDTIKYAFPENNCSSRIIVTTRNVNVALWCCLGMDNRVYKMKALSDIHSRRLFFNQIFGSGNSFPAMLSEVSDEILKICGGLPLAINSISGVLANKPVAKDEWEEVKKSIGYALGENQDLEAVYRILSLSYNDLPPNLKTCLLYLSSFPEDYVIDRDRLVRRWIAEGFISEHNSLSQQDIAERNFYELMNRSIVHPVGIGYDGKVHACRVHDIMLEIITSKSSEHNFITVVGRGKNNLSNSRDFIRRLSVHYIDHNAAAALANKDLSHVRSLTVISSDCIKYLPSLAEFKALRVLDLEGCEGLEKYDMNNIGKLFQLKYIGLKGTSISKLPSQIVMLCDLETLDFWETSVQELPTRFVQLTKLQQLLAGRETKIPSGFGTMSNLRVISGLNELHVYLSLANALEKLGNLTNLNELHVYLECGGPKCNGHDGYKEHEEKLLSSLYKLIGRGKLRSLHIDGKGGYPLEFLESWSPVPSDLRKISMATGYYFTNMPKWIAPALTNLASLDIKLSTLTEDGLQTLGELRALLRLILTLETGEYNITVQGIGFPSLIYFKISSDKGTYVTFVKGAMPRLEYFEMLLSASVGRNYGFYLGIVHLPCLKEAILRVYCDTDSEIGAVIDVTKEELLVHANYPRVKFGWARPRI